ncbi:MAG: lipopolysaccharide biosynthesis protein [Pseudomonadota bacterium]|nr:lipopolysaccharide biosynthesis protein [Pseudomonadota bacterium]
MPLEEETAGQEPAAGRSVFGRLARNTVWILASRGFNSIVSVAYLAIAARALGPENFGAFALILTYAQLLANLVQFQSWKGIVRYGALHMAAQRSDQLERLFGFAATLDFGSAVTGALIAVAGVPLVAPLFDWSPQDQVTVALFAAVLLLTTGSTPSGILRLSDRFDLSAYAEAVGPLTRLVGAITVWAMGAGVVGFLIVWVAAAAAQGVAKWFAAVVVNGARLAFGRSAFHAVVAENERIWRFMLQTNASNSVSLFWLQLGTLAVGAYAGAADAGAFRLARRLAEGIVRPIEPIALAVYPELARLVADDDHVQLRKVVTRITIVSSALALLLVLVTGFAGELILRIFAGKAFEFAYLFLFLLSIATAIELAGFAFEPVQNAHGRSWTILRSKLIAAAVYGLLLLVLLPRMGAQGAAFAAIICSLLIFLQLAFSTAMLLRRNGRSIERAQEEGSRPPPEPQ